MNARILAALLTAIAFGGIGAPAQNQPVRQPDEDVNSPALRERQGLRPNTNLLFNGWGVSPAGEQTLVSDLALKMVVAPDQKRVVAVDGE